MMPLLACPLDVVVEILGWCSPWDLLAVQHSSRDFWTLLRSNAIWHNSRANTFPGFPLPPFGKSQRWFTHFVFKAGPCTVCGRHTAQLPHSFSLEIRFCSVACSFFAFKCHPDDIDEQLVEALVAQPSGAGMKMFLLFSQLPYLEGTQNLHLYQPSVVNAALGRPPMEPTMLSRAYVLPPSTWGILEEMPCPRFMTMCETLHTSIPRYHSQQRAVQEANRTFVEVLAGNEGLDYEELITSSTLSRYLLIFSRDLTRLSHSSAWFTIRDACLAEVAFTINGHCPFCLTPNRSFSAHGLIRHMELQHPDQYVRAPSKLHPCTLCPPGSGPLKWKHLKRHILKKHTTNIAI
ncbi:hypothetical protein K438DRAFT_2009019 [Mycena galopus ATCC 62051]|nr:hypothetical protein K438DRAFT_2009019 [Mycena galopus ATCC 62051]